MDKFYTGSIFLDIENKDLLLGVYNEAKDKENNINLWLNYLRSTESKPIIDEDSTIECISDILLNNIKSMIDLENTMNFIFYIITSLKNDRINKLISDLLFKIADNTGDLFFECFVKYIIPNASKINNFKNLLNNLKKINSKAPKILELFEFAKFDL